MDYSVSIYSLVMYDDSNPSLDPAVTLAMTMVKAITYVRAIILLSMQIAGAIFASYLVSVLFPTPFNVRTTLSTGTSLVRGIFIEATLTAELVFAIFMLAKEKHKATFMAPIGIGLALFVAELVGVFYTGGRQVPLNHDLAQLCSPLTNTQSQPRPLLRPLRRDRHLRPRTLDLLARTCHRRRSSSALLPLHQDSGVRGCESGAR